MEMRTKNSYSLGFYERFFSSFLVTLLIYDCVLSIQRNPLTVGLAESEVGEGTAFIEAFIHPIGWCRDYESHIVVHKNFLYSDQVLWIIV